MRVFGKNVFSELTKNPKQINKVYLSNSFHDQEVIKFIKENHISFVSIDNNKLNSLVEGNHQGIVAEINDYIYGDINDAMQSDKIVILDHLEDPHNFGAIIRTCECAGINRIIIPKDRSVKVNETVMKTSSGALSNVTICMVSNLVNTIEKLKDNNYFIYGADMDGTNYKNVNYTDKVALIIGNEGNGISSLVAKKCDEIVSLPMYGEINSLNASVAAGILIYDLIGR